MSRVSFTQFAEHFCGEVYWLIAGLSVTADGTGVVPLAGAAAVRLLADRVGLTTGFVVGVGPPSVRAGAGPWAGTPGRVGDRRAAPTPRAVPATLQPAVPASQAAGMLAGLVTHRQRSGNAGGVTFLNLEDETGMLRIVCSAPMWNRYRRVGRPSNALVIRSRVEHADGRSSTWSPIGSIRWP